MSVVMPPGARRISSDWTFFYKRLFALLWFSVFIAVSILLILGARIGSAPPGLLVMPPLAIVLGYFLFRKLLWDLLDEVWDNGHELIVINDGHAEQVPFSSITNVNYSGFTNPKRVTLTLQHAGRWGEHITFMPATSLFWLVNLTTSPLVDDLIRRVDEARRKG